jgi:hypothetical protein
MTVLVTDRFFKTVVAIYEYDKRFGVRAGMLQKHLNSVRRKQLLPMEVGQLLLIPILGHSTKLSLVYKLPFCNCRSKGVTVHLQSCSTCYIAVMV